MTHYIKHYNCIKIHACSVSLSETLLNHQVYLSVYLWFLNTMNVNLVFIKWFDSLGSSRSEVCKLARCTLKFKLVFVKIMLFFHEWKRGKWSAKNAFFFLPLFYYQNLLVNSKLLESNINLFVVKMSPKWV